MPSAAGSVLLVDGDCGVCCWIGLQIAGRMEGLRVATIQSELGAEGALTSWHLHSGARTTSGAGVIGGLLEIGGHPRAASLARRTEPLLEPLYRFGARHREVWARVVPRSARERSQARVLQG
jgi:hypothetical protein